MATTAGEHHHAHHGLHGAARDLRYASDKYIATLPLSAALTSLPPLHTVSADASVRDVYHALANYRISSVPIVGADGACLGLVDALDLLLWLAETLPDNMSIRMFMSNERLEDASVSNVKALHLTNHADRDPFVPIHFERLHTAIAEFKNNHRLVVVNPATGAPTAIFSQSAALRFLYNIIVTHPSSRNPATAAAALQPSAPPSATAVGDVAMLTLDELYYVGSTNIVAVKSTDTVGAVIKKMAEQRVYAVPVVSAETGAIMFNFSAADLKDLYAHSGGTTTTTTTITVATANEGHTFNVFNKTVKEFLESHSALPPVCVAPTISLFSIMRLMLDEGGAGAAPVGSVPTGHVIHRVYVVDNHNKPVRVVSITDVLNVFIMSDYYPSHK